MNLNGKVELQGVSMVASPNFYPQIHQKKHRVRGLCRAGGTLCPFGLAVLGWYRQANWRMTIVFVARYGAVHLLQNAGTNRISTNML